MYAGKSLFGEMVLWDWRVLSLCSKGGTACENFPSCWHYCRCKWSVKLSSVRWAYKILFSQLTHSDATSVTLRGVTRDLTGQFQCEVSEDAPLFHTDIRTATMQVIELPNDEPRITVEKKTLFANDNLKATCTVGTSFPSANITWYINNKKVIWKY